MEILISELKATTDDEAIEQGLKRLKSFMDKQPIDVLFSSPGFFDLLRFTLTTATATTTTHSSLVIRFALDFINNRCTPEFLSTPPASTLLPSIALLGGNHSLSLATVALQIIEKVSLINPSLLPQDELLKATTESQEAVLRVIALCFKLIGKGFPLSHQWCCQRIASLSTLLISPDIALSLAALELATEGLTTTIPKVGSASDDAKWFEAVSGELICKTIINIASSSPVEGDSDSVIDPLVVSAALRSIGELVLGLNSLLFSLFGFCVSIS